jgi:tetratricopeptide (TPR) repeat protein
VQIRQIGCLYNLAQSYSALGDLENAKRFYHQVILRARAQREHAYLLRGLNGLGNVLRNSDMWGEAVHSYTEALELALALSDFGSAAAAAQNRGVLAGTHGLYQNAIRDLTDSLHYVSRITTHYSFEKTLACRSHVELGKIFISLKRFDAAQDELDRAWHMAEKDPDLTDFRFWVLHARCRLWQACGDTERLKQDLGKLPFYANTDEKRKKLYEVEPPTTAVLASSQTVAATEFEFLIKLTHDL